MIVATMVMLFFAIVYSVKGGWHWRIPGLKRLDHGIAGWVIDGTQLSCILVAILVGFILSPFVGAFFGLMLWIGQNASMGEEGGAIGNYKEQYGPYLALKPEPVFWRLRGRTLLSTREGVIYGWKKGLQRGVWLGFPLTVFTGLTDFVLWGLAWPFLMYAGNSLNVVLNSGKKNYKRGWHLAEPMIGAVCIGIPAAKYLTPYF